MSQADVFRILVDYHASALSGDSSQILGIVHYISSLPLEQRSMLRICKVIYTSESLTIAQRAHILAVLGPISICSILGSAEAGPYAASNPKITGTDPSTGYEDFIFDTRATIFEVLPHSFSMQGSDPEPLSDGTQGIIAQTSLTRLRNPVVRYITGDVGSLHPLPEQARSQIPEVQWPYLRILRFHGRDRRFSFEWDGEYIEFHGLTTLMNSSECGILQWQVILDKMESSLEARLEIRLLCMPRNTQVLSKPELVERVTTFFHVYHANCHRFELIFVNRLDEFSLSSTGRKIVKFVDRYSEAGLMDKWVEPTV
jgi:phenylacetate-coenzyme A ligase PaaK-like adenylate-forming protein